MSWGAITGLVARAGRAFKPVDGKDPTTEGAALAEFLRSDAPLGPDERELLAQLVTGEWGRPNGRPARVGPGHPYAVALVSDYRRRVAEHGPGGEEAAAQDAARAFDTSPRTVRRYAEEAREREEIIAREEAKARVAGK